MEEVEGATSSSETKMKDEKQIEKKTLLIVSRPQRPLTFLLSRSFSFIMRIANRSPATRRTNAPVSSSTGERRASAAVVKARAPLARENDDVDDVRPIEELASSKPKRRSLLLAFGALALSGKASAAEPPAGTGLLASMPGLKSSREAAASAATAPTKTIATSSTTTSEGAGAAPFAAASSSTSPLFTSSSSSPSYSTNCVYC